jgi:asparagine synthase (glutamine-hydrolysing)
MFKEQVIKPLIPLPVRNLRRELRGGKQPWEHYSPIHPDFARRIHLADEMLKTGHDPAFGMVGDTLKLRYKGIRPGRSMMGCLLRQIGTGFGMEIRDPTMDRRVLEFCLAIPDNQYLREGNDRFLVRRAMKGLLPAEVLLNRKRGLQAPDAVARLRMCAGQAEEMLENMQNQSRRANQYLDMKKMWDVLKGLEQESDDRAARRNSFILLRGLMTGLFLCNFESKK